MSETKHTPGPWAVIADGPTRVVATDTSRPWRIAVVDSPSDADPDVDANARLIAAAPELLAALEEVTSTCLDAGFHGSDLARSRAAIAKAKGKAT